MTPFEIGKSNADMAVDQQGNDLRGSISSYYENALETLGEYFQGAEYDHQVYEMDRGFISVLVAANITDRPWIAGK